MGLQTEYEFTLPFGFADSGGNLHKNGIMRLATAADEIYPLNDPRVKQNPAYISVIILSRVIVKLGTLNALNTSDIENLFSADLFFLQDFYQRINSGNGLVYNVECPHCKRQIELPPDFFMQGQ